MAKAKTTAKKKPAPKPRKPTVSIARGRGHGRTGATKANPEALHRVGRKMTIYLSPEVAGALYAKKGATGEDMSVIVEKALRKHLDV